jgi:hypothetical protein
MKHKHHLVPRHSGGTDNPYNLVEVSITQHAMFHWCEWQRTGNEFDKIAWKCLSGQIGKDGARKLALREAQARKVKEGSHPFLLQNRTWDLREAAKKASETQLKRGTKNFLTLNKSKERRRGISENQKLLVANGTHHLLAGNETWDRSEISKRVARRRVEDGTCPLLAQNRNWDQSLLAKKARDNMDPVKLSLLIRKQTINRRINSGWTHERITFIFQHLPLSSNKIFNLCKSKFEWPNSRGVIQNVIRVLEKEGLNEIFNLNYLTK